MKSVIENESILIIKNSKFICRIHQIDSKEKINKYLEQAKTDYPNATHYCYAYIIDNNMKESDDGEPSGTAGIPILQVLQNNQLDHILCIVIRYFGKIKLGASGLIRAYTKSVTSCLDNHIIKLNNGYLINITFPYSKVSSINYIISNSKILKKEFKDLITYQLIVTEDTLESLKNIDIDIQITKKTYI